jgi:hypothetical protein
MADTLSDGSTTIELPVDLLWQDEFAWSPIIQSKAYSWTGSLIVESRGKSNGRPMTLVAGDTWGWCDRQVVEDLFAMAKQAGVELVLEYRGETYSVVFDGEAVPVEARPVIDYSDPVSDDQYVLTLRLIQISYEMVAPPS